MNIFYPPVLSRGQAKHYSACLAWKYPQLAESLNGRIEAAAKIASSPCTIVFSRELPGCYDVYSDSKRFHTVDPARKACTCEVSALGQVCVHRLAVALWKQGPGWAHEKLCSDFNINPKQEVNHVF